MSQPKSSGKSMQVEEPVFETANTKTPQDQGGDIEEQPMSRQLQGITGSRNLRDLQLLTVNGVLQNLLILDRPNNAQGRQVVPANYFFNNDLKYLKGGSSSRKYTTSTTKTKAARYDNIEGIKDMVPELWSLVKFCDGTLISVRWVLHDIANNLRMDYLPKRRWSNLDRKRSRIMIKAINQQLFERRFIRNLEKFVGG
ncbi:hypothetical protein Tco_1084741 [Tanacetum coccineum]